MALRLAHAAAAGRNGGNHMRHGQVPLLNGHIRPPSDLGVAPLQGLADLGSWRSGGMGGDPPARVQGGRQRWASCRGRWKRRDKAARVRVGRTTGPRAARFSPEDRNGGNACIGYPAFNGEVLTTSAAPAAGDAIPVGRGWCLPTAGWERSGPQAPRPVEQRHPDPPPNG